MSAALALSAPTTVRPSTPSPTQWITREDFLRFAKRSGEWLRIQRALGQVETRETARLLPNGRKEVEFAVSSLQPAALARYQAEHRSRSAQPATLDLFGPSHLSLVEPRRIALKSAALPQADARMDILQGILAFRQAKQHGQSYFGIRLELADGTPVDSVHRMVAFQAEQAAQAGKPVSTRTIYTWLSRYDKGGMAELAKRKRRDANQSRWFSEHPEAACLVASLYLGDGMFPGLSIQACYDMLRTQREMVGVAEADLPDRTTVGRFLHSTPEHLKLLARKGRKKYQEAVLPYLRRGYTEAANQIWVSDHMIADVEVQNDCFPDQPMGAPIRLRLTAVLDYRSRFLVGYSWCWEGTSTSIATAVRRAVLAHGPADHWYCDNGKDYIKVAKGATPGYLQHSPAEPEGWVDAEIDRLDRQTGILGRLGMRVTHCLPHHPQSKHVERFFRTVHAQFCSLWWTYTTGTPFTRPDSTTALMEIQRKAVRTGELSRGMHPKATQFMAAFQVWLDSYHAIGDRKMEGMDGRSPAQVFAEERNPNQRPSPSNEELACLLAEHTTAKVDACAVRVNKRRYVPSDDTAAHFMQRFHGQKVTVAYDPLDPSVVAILDDHLHLITLLSAETLVRFAPEDPETQRQIADSMAQRGRLARTTREQLQLITRDRKRLGIRNPLELLAENAAAIDTEEVVTQRTPKLSKLTQSQPRQTYTADAVEAFFSRK